MVTQIIGIGVVLVGLWLLAPPLVVIAVGLALIVVPELWR